MFDAIKERWREAMAIGPLKQEWAKVCPDSALRAKHWDNFGSIRKQVECPHNESHTLSFVIEMFRMGALHKDREGVFVEAGCFKGGSTAKFSIVADHLDRKLVVCDSFQGLPDNEEKHDRSIFGYSIRDWFRKGAFCGRREEVERNVSDFGVAEVCEFVEGWFDETLPHFEQPVLGAYIDVDLASSTKTCLKYLYPRLVPGGVIVSQDGDFPLVVEVFKDTRFWEEELGVPSPNVEGLGTRKILRIVKGSTAERE
jgi:O-methyltransferase